MGGWKTREAPGPRGQGCGILPKICCFILNKLAVLFVYPYWEYKYHKCLFPWSGKGKMVDRWPKRCCLLPVPSPSYRALTETVGDFNMMRHKWLRGRLLLTWVKSHFSIASQSWSLQSRRGSRINTDWFSTSREVRGHDPLGNVLAFNSPKSPFLGFRVIQTGHLLTALTIFQISTWKV